MSYGLQQLISDPTLLLLNSSSYIDLIFTDQPILIVDSGFHPSLHSKCHHLITYCRCNLTVEYPTPMKDLSEIIYILTNWDHLFINKDAHQQVKILTDAFFFFNFTPYKVVTFDHRDPP